jgi:hypothetical protein
MVILGRGISVAVMAGLIGFGSSAALATPPVQSKRLCVVGACKVLVPASNKGKCVNDCKAGRDRCLSGAAARQQSGKDRCWVAYGRCTDTCGDALDR